MKRSLNIDGALWSAVLLLLFYSFIKLIYSGNIKNFIHPDMIKYSIFGAVAIGIMMLYSLTRIFTFNHSEGIKYGYILFLIPVVIYIFLKPTGLSESAAINRGVNLLFYKALNTEEHNHSHSHSHGDGNMIVDNGEILLNNENFFTSIDEIYGHIDDYKDKTVVIKGFALKEKGNNKGFILSRMIVSCCAADTEVIGIRSEYNYSKAITGGQWLEVRGKFKQENKAEAPVIVVEKLKAIDKPEDSYIYRD